MKFINVQRSINLFLELSGIFIDIFKLLKILTYATDISIIKEIKGDVKNQP